MSQHVVVWDEDEKPEYLTFINANTIVPKWSVGGTPLEYSLDNGDSWSNCTSGESVNTHGSNCLFRGEGRNSLFNEQANANVWSVTGNEVEITGNFNTLLDYTRNVSVLGAYTFTNLLYGCADLKYVHATLPAKKIGFHSYRAMFSKCVNLVNTPALPGKTLDAFCYEYMFENCRSLTTAPELPATNLVENCYKNMFINCSGLTNAPGADRYTTYTPAQGGMFSNDTNLVDPVPFCAIPASWGGGEGSCLYLSFNNATSIIPQYTTAGTSFEYKLSSETNWVDAESGATISILEGDRITFRGTGRTSLFEENTYGNHWVVEGTDVAITGDFLSLLDYQNPPAILGDNAFCFMFTTNASITYVEKMPNVELSNSCYAAMFGDCTNLTHTPELPATTLATNCYGQMFKGCSSLVNVPSLPITTLFQDCYYHMFQGCTSIVDAPALPANVLPRQCYEAMFMGCTSLVNAPALPALTLADGCYLEMFAGCTALETAPTLLATYLPGEDTYRRMFAGCTALLNAPNADVYTRNDHYQVEMFADAVNVKTPLLWCEIPTNFGGGGSSGCPYFTINGATAITPNWTASGVNIQYKIGANQWNTASSGTVINANGSSVMFRGTGNTSLYTAATSTNAWTITGTNVSLSGELGKILNHQAPVILGPLAFANMFQNCTVISDISNLILPDTTSADCYNQMFYGNSNLTKIPVLPATVLSPRCYAHMFRDCTNLAQVPLLPVSTLEVACYYGMFANTKITTAPVLPATQLVDDCYKLMFFMCSSLTNAPGADRYTNYTPAQEQMFTDATNVVTPIPWSDIPTTFGGGGATANYFTIKNATSVTPRWTVNGTPLQYKIGANQWINATSGTAIPVGGAAINFRGSGRTTLNVADSTPNSKWDMVGTEIEASGNINTLLDWQNPPTTLGAFAFSYLFTTVNLVNIENLTLPATTMGNNCYKQLFSYCTKLTKGPALPAENLADACYRSMFQGCTALTESPELPARTLKNLCYSVMFSGCTALATAPELPSTTLATSCYHLMFQLCNALTVAPDLPAGTLPTDCYRSMFDNCTGLIEAPHSDVYTAKTPQQAGMFNGAINVLKPLPWYTIPTGFGGGGEQFYDYFTIRNATSVTPVWTVSGAALQYKIGADAWTNATSKTAVPTGGNVIMFRGTNRTTLFTADSGGNQWTFEGTNIYASGSCNTLLNYTAETVNVGTMGFTYLFYNCKELITAPKLPSTSIGNSSYMWMFRFCEKLIEAPELPATYGVTTNTYHGMFGGCKSLKTAPELPATALGDKCYNLMFHDCTSLETAPDLPAIVTKTSCYDSMFVGCTSLVNVPDTLPALAVAQAAYAHMFEGCTSLVSAPQILATSVTTYSFNSMFVNCTSLINAPDLLPTQLYAYSYQAMFQGCTSLVNAPLIAATVVYNFTCQNMFNSCTNLVNGPNLLATQVYNSSYYRMFIPPYHKDRLICS
jgi:hypothetical protein